MAQARDARGRYISGTGSNPGIAVAIRAVGLTQTIASFKAMQAQARLTFAHMVKSSQQARASLEAMAKPVTVSIRGLQNIARVTALVGTLAAAVAGLEIQKEFDAGNAVTGFKAGIEVAIDRTGELQQKLADARAEFDRTPISQSGPVLQQIRSLEAEISASRNVSVGVEDQWKRIIGVANELGQEVEKVAPGFVQLANATKGTSLAGKQTDMIFRGLLQTSRAMSLSADETSRAGIAIAQVASKQKWSAEEAQQLAEAGIPANKILQQELGVTAQQFVKMQADGISAEVALTALARGMSKNFGGKAAELANGPAASVARLKNSIFLARAEVSNAGLAKGLGVIATSAQQLVDRLASTGKLTQFGAAIGRGLEGVPAMLQRLAAQYELVRFYARQWIDQMRIALGLDMTGWADRSAAGFAWLRQTLFQLAFDIPGVIYAMRQAFAGNDGNVADRYKWVLPLRDFIQNELMPILQRIPGILAEWWPAIKAAADIMISAITTIHQAFFGLFGEEAGRKILAFMVIAKVTGAFSAFAATISTVSTIVRGAMTAFTLLSSPVGWIVLAIAALVAGFIYAYTHFETFRKAVDTVVAAVWAVIKWFFGAVWDKVKGTFDGVKQIWEGITEILTNPFQAAKKIIDGIMKVITGGYGFGDLIKGGKIILSKVSSVFGFASGGYVRGPGTGTSDSIPAMLSNREGVINAAATRHYGGERFIDSLNNQTFSPFAAPADVIEVSSGGTGRPMSFVMPGVGVASGRVDDDFADGMKRVFDRATAGRARQAKPRGHR
ncbi:tape measure protein [Sphingomonas sanguinis]|uniref:tape measure protein n=1 Tax=Sphingomonas sp. LC-1 TaxID=3110957 RepID=UPI0021BA5FAD|nr:tape measure protein [Sphingomonas sp. LC-1]MCT8000563.1 tape measure protein [Sphingomonas sp. LC-1]